MIRHVEFSFLFRKLPPIDTLITLASRYGPNNPQTAINNNKQIIIRLHKVIFHIKIAQGMLRNTNHIKYWTDDRDNTRVSGNIRL